MLYIFKFYMDKEKDALQELINNNYHENYKNDGRQIYLIGIDFDKDKKNICKFNYKIVK